MSTLKYMVRAVSRWDNACQFLAGLCSARITLCWIKGTARNGLAHDRQGRGRTGPVMIRILDGHVASLLLKNRIETGVGFDYGIARSLWFVIDFHPT